MTIPERAQIENKLDELVTCKFLLPEDQLSFRSWLNNFEQPSEVKAAVKLLDHFVFLTEDYCSHAIASIYRRYLKQASGIPIANRPTDGEALQQHKRSRVTPVQGESPNPADSGYAYARLARDRLNIDESRIVPLEAAIAEAKKGYPVVLIDDFCGTGDQICKTLLSKANGTCLAQLASQSIVSCIVVAITSKGLKRIKQSAPSVSVFAAHTLQVKEHTLSALLPESEHADVYGLLRKYAKQLNVPRYINPIFGYKELGLLLGVHDSIPDASLPIFWASGPPGWTPLKEKKL